MDQAPYHTIPVALDCGRTLEDHKALVRELRARGEPSDALLMQAVMGAVGALADEFRAGRMILRFSSEDFVYDRELGVYAIAADTPRYELDAPPSGLSLLDNGVYAPELTKQITRPLSPRTDVYSLGALLYYLITGLEPIAEFSRLAGKLPPVRIFEANMPLGIDPILRRAVARMPEDRFSDAVALLEALEGVLHIDGLRCMVEIDTALGARYGSATHAGINKGTKNPHNQDQFFCALEPERGLGLFLVADGVSTCELGSGDRAAAHVMEATQSVWEEILASPSSCASPSSRSPGSFQAWLGRIFEEANEAICAEVHALYPGKIQQKTRIMSSTAVAVFLNGRHAHIGNVGDSRVYLIREGLMDQVTIDLDQQTRLLRQGQGLEALVNASGLGELTSAIGVFTTDGEGFRAAPVVPEYNSVRLLAGDRLLICSDGVPDCIGLGAEERISDIVLGADRPARGTWNLIVAANEHGGDDNITAILLEFTGEEVASWATSSRSKPA